jgi:alpha-beta hydrolase superfamily lysophospholipase
MQPRVFIVTLIVVAGQACSSGPPLKPWHTETLTTEFSARRTDEIKTFDAYLRLEDELFAELDEKIYAQTGTGPEYQLVRYSRGSAADPQSVRPDWNRSFELAAEAPAGGVLLLHGMSDSPYSFRALGQMLNEQDYWVIGLRLPGHGTAPSGLRRVSWQDMSAAVRLAMEHLANKVGPKPIHIIGYSTGAPLALDYALDALDGEVATEPASLVLISPAIRVHATAALATFKDSLSALPGMSGFAWLSILPEFDPYKYNSFATNAGAQVHRITRSVTRRIAAKSDTGDRMPPILVFKSAVDATVTTDAVVDDLLGNLAPDRHELVLFDINRFAAASSLLIADPGPLTDRIMAAEDLPFAVTLVGNESPESRAVVARRKNPGSATFLKAEPLDIVWPTGVISLSHVALPIPPDDPVYGESPPEKRERVFLGRMVLQGERGLLKIPENWMLRMRYNPFYSFLEARTLKWLKAAGAG